MGEGAGEGRGGKKRKRGSLDPAVERRKGEGKEKS